MTPHSKGLDGRLASYTAWLLRLLALGCEDIAVTCRKGVGSVCVRCCGVFKPVEVIMHAVPKGRGSLGEAEEPVYSEAPIALTPTTRTFIQQRLRRSLGGYARPVAEDTAIGSDVPGKARFAGIVEETGRA